MRTDNCQRLFEDVVGGAGYRGGRWRMQQELETYYGEVSRRTTRRYGIVLLCIAMVIGTVTTVASWPSNVILSAGADRGTMESLTQQIVERL